MSAEARLFPITKRHFEARKPTMEPDPTDPTKMRQTAYCQWCATRRPDDDPRWPCETAQLLALLADTPSVEPLDGARLARAIEAWWYDPNDPPEMVVPFPANLEVAAPLIAAEYDALLPTQASSPENRE